MKKNSLIKTSFLLAAGFILTSATSHAALAYHIIINTSTLNTLPNVANGLFSLDFQLNSGDTLNNNSATINNFTFNGGGAFGSATFFGGATGDLGSAITLTDSGAFNEIYQAFNAGSTIQFDLFLSQNVDTGFTPDSFTISLLDNTLSNITTDSTDGANTLLHLDINSPTAGNQYAGMNFASGTGSYSSVAAIPEPSAIMLGVVACGFGVFRRRRNAC